MFTEGQTPETLNNKQEIIDFLATIIPGYSETEFNEPVGEDQTSLSEFLENRREGSEWTDPHGSANTEIKINIVNGKYQVTVKKEF